MENFVMHRNLTCITAIIVILFLFFTGACGSARRGDPQAAGYIDIEAVTSPLHLKEGDSFFITYHRHASVGLGAVYEMEDETIVNLIDDITWYRNPAKMMIPGITGADEGSGCFVFRALKKGETKLTIWEDFRGEKRKELKSLTIVVE
jgi:hypothetical protein